MADKEKKSQSKSAKNPKIEINPKLEVDSTALKEAATGTVVLGWGRMNPITIGHEKLVDKVKSVAQQKRGVANIYLSHSEDPKKNPLSYSDKIALAKKAFGNMIVRSKAKTIIQVMQELQKKYANVVLVVGSDRVQQFETLLNKYNGKDFTFDSIDVVSAGERDPDADDVSGMSASKMRQLASDGNEKEFKKGLPRKLRGSASAVYDMVRTGMKLAEELEQEGVLEEAVLSLQQRRKRAMIMRKYKSKIKMARKRALRRAATLDKIKLRARKKAINIIRRKVAGKKGLDYAKLSPGEKMIIDKKVAKRKAAIDRIAKRMIPQVRRADLMRLSGKKMTPVSSTKEEYDTDFEFEMFMEAVAQDRDIKDRKGTQPAKYHKGLAPSTKSARDAQFKKQAKMDDDNPKAYKPAPGDKEAKTKPSKYTKRYHQMFGKDNKVKLDARFRAFRSSMIENQVERIKNSHKREKELLKKQHDDEIRDAKIRALQREDLEILDWIDVLSNDISESVDLDEAKASKALKDKAEKSGISYGILKKVFDRGVAAWRTGHRPGTTPQQWGFARVNSYITKGKTYHTTDKDLREDTKKFATADKKKYKETNKKNAPSPLDEGVNDPGIFKAVFLAGGPGSGKSFIVGKTALTTFGLRLINSDDAFEQSLKKAGLKTTPKDIFSPKGQEIRVSAKALTAKKMQLAMNGRLGLVVDGTGKDYDRIAKQAAQLRGMGYETAMVFVNTDLETAQARNAKRARTLPAKEVETMWKDVQKNIGKFQNFFGRNMFIVDNSDGANWEGAVQSTYKKIGAWTKAPIKNPVALKWIKNAKAERGIKEGYVSNQIGKVVYKKKYNAVSKILKDVLDRKKKETGGKLRHSPEYYAMKILQTTGLRDKLDSRTVAKMVSTMEGYGDMDRGTPELTKKYLKDTPHQPSYVEIMNNIVKKQKDGSLTVAEDTDGVFVTTNPKLPKKKLKGGQLLLDNVTIKQIKDLEIFADRLLNKFDIDIEFTKHFADRMNDSRNNPGIKIAELQQLFKKIAKQKGSNIKKNANAEVVLKDIQKDLNLPVVIKYMKDRDEFEVVNKTIMRKKNFSTSNKTIEYK